ncbi:MAG TPA: SDR family oxidoreductase [Usitatibacteraceae bacterium]|jgi:enoyl-[acyl-carrier protein] reductase I|nr:SDR family oxidoreductase [Usitatibacteraceae bacterium]
MGFLKGKRILVTGMLSNRSIAYGVARACHREGAELAFTYQGEGIRDRVADLAREFGDTPLLACDVTDDAQIDAVFAALGERWGHLDGVVHAIAFAPREALKGEFHESTTREAFRVAHDISSYSLVALARGAAPLMKGRAGAIVTLSYLGAIRSVPHYNVMGLAKASLESAVRYLATSLGPHNVRVNAISAGPIKTLAAAGIGDFGKIFRFVERNAPLRRNVTTEEVGNVTAFLLSDLSSGITGEVTYVDAGFSTTTAGLGAED